MGFFNKYPYTDFHELNLDWVIKTVKAVIQAIDNLDDWKNTHEAQYEQLKQFYDDMMAGVLPSAVYQSLTEWISNNAFDLIGSMIKQVYFGLNDQGYFVVNIPSQWNDLIFNTTEYDIFTPLQQEYGHLTISY